jgi:hypothetical protein
VRPALSDADRKRLQAAWRLRRRVGRPLNYARLVKAAFTFDGAARYAAWKIERHTGMPVALTPWRERHPLLAAPGVLWRLWRQRQAQGQGLDIRKAPEVSLQDLSVSPKPEVSLGTV